MLLLVKKTHIFYDAIACSVQELWWSKVKLTNCDIRSKQQAISCLRFRYHLRWIGLLAFNN
jgi:hypothetical protein